MSCRMAVAYPIERNIFELAQSMFDRGIIYFHIMDELMSDEFNYVYDYIGQNVYYHYYSSKVNFNRETEQLTHRICILCFPTRDEFDLFSRLEREKIVDYFKNKEIFYRYFDYPQCLCK